MRDLIRLALVPGAILLAVWAMAPAVARAQAEGVISGRVENGTPGAGIPARLELLLHVMQGDREVASRTTTTNATGRFEFSHVPLGPSLAYVIITDYAGASYTFTVDPSQPAAPVTLIVYESTTAPTALRVAGDTMVVTGAEAGRRQLTVLELVTLENTGDRAYVPDVTQPGAMQNLLRFSLPPRSMNLDVRSTLRSGTWVQVDKGFALIAPVPPGRHDISFTYSVGYSGSTLEFARSFPAGAEVFRLLVPERTGTVRSPELADLGTRAFGETIYRLYQGEGLGAGATLQIGFGGLPQPSLLVRWRNGLSSARAATIGVPAVLGVALLALLLYATNRRRQTPAYATASGSFDLEGLAQDRQTLIEAIARLDDMMEARAIEEREYKERRRELKVRLLQVTLEEERWRSQEPGPER